MCHEVGDADLFVTCRQHKAAWRKKLERFRFFFRTFVHSNEICLEDTCTHFEKYSSKLDISRSFIPIFEICLEDTCTHFEKYPSKLDISRSFIRIFASRI